MMADFDDETIDVMNDYIKRAAETDQVFFVGGFAIQQQRTPLTKNDAEGFPMLSTGVTFLFFGGTTRERGATVFHIDVDDIDSLCESLQTAKDAPYASENESTVHIAYRPQQQTEGD